MSDRIAWTSSVPALKSPYTPEEVLRQFKTFYYDTALCGHDPSFSNLVAFVPPENMVVGSDDPYASLRLELAFAQASEDREWTPEYRRLFYEGNAGRLFPKLVSGGSSASSVTGVDDAVAEVKRALAHASRGPTPSSESGHLQGETIAKPSSNPVPIVSAV